MVPRAGFAVKSWAFTHAKARALVQCPDGRTGRLVYVSPNSKVAKVVILGRHYRYRLAELKQLNETGNSDE
jgi:hypothetical protein